MTQARIHRRRPVLDPRSPEGKIRAVRVTYSTPRRPPRTVIVEGESPTDNDIREAIRADMEAVEASEPEFLEL